MLIPLKEDEIIKTVLDNVSQELDYDSKIALISLFQKLGLLEKATQMANSIQELKQNADGLLTLATLYYHLSKKDQALKFAHQGLIIISK